MFAYLRNRVLLASLLVVFTILGSSSSTRFKLKFEGPEVEDMCNETVDPRLCEKIMFSNPLTPYSDIPGLARYMVNYGQHNITVAINQIQSILPKTTDPHAKKKYTDCVTYLKWSSTFCDNALKALAGRDKTHFIENLLSAQSSGEDCGDSLNRGDYVKRLIEVSYSVFDIAVALANKLP